MGKHQHNPRGICLHCGKKIEQGRPDKLTCDTRCRVARSRHIKQRPPRVYRRTCPYCYTRFETQNRAQMYCNEKHRKANYELTRKAGA